MPPFFVPLPPFAQQAERQQPPFDLALLRLLKPDEAAAYEGGGDEESKRRAQAIDDDGRLPLKKRRLHVEITKQDAEQAASALLGLKTG